MALVWFLLLHVVVVGLIAMAHALHAKLAPAPSAASSAAPDPDVSLATDAVPPLSGRKLEDYVTTGLVDLRIMLAQAARRHD